MSRFDTLSQRFGAGMMLRQHGENVRFRSPGVPPKVVKAMVDRGQPELESSGGPNPARQTPVMTVSVKDDRSEGVAVDEITPEESEIEVAFLKGESPKWRRVVRLSPDGQFGGYVDMIVKT